MTQISREEFMSVFRAVKAMSAKDRDAWDKKIKKMTEREQYEWVKNNFPD